MNEKQNIEWKVSWRDEYLKWICGFANAQGGVLEIGRDDDGRVVGVHDAAKLLEDLPNKIRDLLGILPDVDLVSESGKEFVRITVQARPYPVSYKGQYHYRCGSTKQLLKGQALDRFLLSRTGKRWDAVPVPGVSVDDLDVNVLADFRQRSAKSGRLGSDVLEENDATLIEKLRLADGEYLKRAAVLLFHPDPERYVTGASIKIGYFENNAELVYHDEICGDLFGQVDRAMDLLLTKYLKASISYEGVQRIETHPVPPEALRETLLNAVAHKDYASGAPIQISVYDDRIMFWNNGQLPDEWTVERLIAKHPSLPYNPDVANALFRAGMIEAWGRGIEKVMHACDDRGMARPELRYERPGIWVEFALESQVRTKAGPSRDQVEVLQKCLQPSAIRDLMVLFRRTNRTKFRDQVLNSLLNDGLIEMTVPDKPQSSKQKYRTTTKGHAVLNPNKSGGPKQ
ncbi:MAG: transcriptional regulator [bacterium]|nr:transcriptional regulator [bacterium]